MTWKIVYVRHRRISECLIFITSSCLPSARVYRTNHLNPINVVPHFAYKRHRYVKKKLKSKQNILEDENYTNKNCITYRIFQHRKHIIGEYKTLQRISAFLHHCSLSRSNTALRTLRIFPVYNMSPLFMVFFTLIKVQNAFGRQHAMRQVCVRMYASSGAGSIYLCED